MASEHDDLSKQDLAGINVFGGNEFEQGTKYDLKTVGSPQNHQAAVKRRLKHGIHQCPFRNAGCNATFTARHNLRYHINAHLNLKPYKCGECSYAAASPANTKRHRVICKGIAKERNDMVPKQDYPPSQELADIKLTDRFHFSSRENEISYPGDSQDVPAARADPSKAIPSSRSSVGPSATGSSVINIEAVDDDIMAAELLRIQQAADKQWEKDDRDPNESVKPSHWRGEITARRNKSTSPCIEAQSHRAKRRKRGKKQEDERASVS